MIRSEETLSPSINVTSASEIVSQITSIRSMLANSPHGFHLKPSSESRTVCLARAHGMRTYEPRQGRKAATVVCSTSAVVTLAFWINLRHPQSLRHAHRLSAGQCHYGGR